MQTLCCTTTLLQTVNCMCSHRKSLHLQSKTSSDASNRWPSIRFYLQHLPVPIAQSKTWVNRWKTVWTITDLALFICCPSSKIEDMISRVTDRALRALRSVLCFRRAVSVQASQPSHRDSPVQTLAPFGQTPLQCRMAESTETCSELHSQHKLLYKHLLARRNS